MKIFTLAALALSFLFQASCNTSGGGKMEKPCGTYPAWSTGQDVRSGEFYDFNGTLYQASADSRDRSPLDNPTLWNATSCAAAQALDLKADAWRLVWSDEFDGAELDTSKWTYNDR